MKRLGILCLFFAGVFQYLIAAVPSRTIALSGKTASKGVLRERNSSRGTPDTVQNLAAWFRADDTPSSGAISSWPDRSPKGHTMTQVITSSQPVGATVLGERCVTFDSNDVLVTNSFSLSHPYTIFLVAGNTGGTGAIFIDGSTANQSRIAQNCGVTDCCINAGASLNISNAGFGAGGIQKSIYALFNGASSAGEINEDGQRTGNAGSSTPSVLRLGGVSGATTSMSIWELIVYTGSLSVSDRIKIQDYLQARYQHY